MFLVLSVLYVFLVLFPTINNQQPITPSKYSLARVAEGGILTNFPAVRRCAGRHAKAGGTVGRPSDAKLPMPPSRDGE